MSRKLDAAIAEALGYEVVQTMETTYEIDVIVHAYTNKMVIDGKRKKIPHYTTDGNGMLELDREMRARGYELELHKIGEYYGADYYHLEDEIGGDIQQANTEPLARALAAYKALTGKEWQDGNN